jgi:formylglycine-generating enzyme required for sulfatase activity
MPPSCIPAGAGTSACGGNAVVSCCDSPEVPGATFYRSYDGISSGYTSTAFPATVSTLRIDRFEVTVGRFRQFVSAWDAGWRPASGSGLHSHLNSGRGLTNAGAVGGYETGWSTAWASNLGTTLVSWTTNLTASTPATWTEIAGANEKLPITEETWFEAYAFCIWDGGFLPSEAEWNNAASGGTDQRAYPWSPAYPPGSAAITCSEANYNACSGATLAVGSLSPAGDGKYGHSDLAGNADEWVLDWKAPLTASCVDCADLSVATDRVRRGGGFPSTPAINLASYRDMNPPTTRSDNDGFRCARVP